MSDKAFADWCVSNPVDTVHWRLADVPIDAIRYIWDAGLAAKEAENARLTQELKAAEEEWSLACTLLCRWCGDGEPVDRIMGPGINGFMFPFWLHQARTCHAHELRERRHQRIAEKQSA